MAMSKVRMNPVKYQTEDGRILEFTPKGKMHERGDASEFYTDNVRQNPLKRHSVEPTQGARILIGFNVGIEQKWTMKDIVKFVFRREQVESAINDGDAQEHPLGGDVGITFLAQEGIWQAVRETNAYPEQGAQVLMMNIISEKPKRFIKDMSELADAMVTEFQQQAVLLEITKNGVVKENFEFGP